MRLLRCKIILLFAFAFSFFLLFRLVEIKFKNGNLNITSPFNTVTQLTVRRLPVLYAVYSSNTPTIVSYRAFDYAFYLPMTALAWERIGFRSIIVIAGYRHEWENDPTFSLVLSYLAMRKATVIFVPSKNQHRTMISQTARILSHNLAGFPAADSDYVITTDADLWPIHREHYLPHHSSSNCKLTLLHSDCCGYFQWNGTTYREYPMMNIGATVSTWKEIINNLNHPVLSNVDQSCFNLFQSYYYNIDSCKHIQITK